MKKILFTSLVVSLFFGMYSCDSNVEINNKEIKEEVKLDSISSSIEEVSDTNDVLGEEMIFTISELELNIIDHGLVSVPDSISNIQSDLKYASSDNFMGFNLYGSLSKVYLQKEVMQKLIRSSEYLRKEHPSLNLLVYDAVRPRSVQQMMWDSLDMPVHQKVKFVSNPRNGSLHNFGCAVDITISDSLGNAIDMGAGYDDIRKIAYPKYEKAYLDSGMISQQQIDNRNLLRKVMRKGGFWGIQTEWWHFNAMSRDAARSKYKMVE